MGYFLPITHASFPHFNPSIKLNHTLSKFMEIRQEKPEDKTAIHHLHRVAFQRENEANLVENLRKNTLSLSFVLLENQTLIGHLLFTPVTLKQNSSQDIHILGLAPLAILPDYQHQGKGSLLLNYGLEQCRKLSYHAIVVLGHPDYYHRFGFISAKEKGFSCEYDVPDDVFMILELRQGILKNIRGTIAYHPAFNTV